MKKILTLLLTCLLVLSLGACSFNESNTSFSTQNTQEQTLTQEEITEEVDKKETTEEVIEETKEENKEDVKEEIKKEIDPEELKTYKYWVVFYDHDGNELQREALKYGTIPEYNGPTPYYDDGENWYYFDGWTNKKGENKSFKPIIGNTKFYAKFVVGGKISHSDSGSTPTPPPAPSCTSTEDLYYFTYINGDSWSGYDTYYDYYQYNGSAFVFVGNLGPNHFSPFDPISENVWYHFDGAWTFTECTDPNHHGV